MAEEKYHHLWLSGAGNPNRQATPNPLEKKKGKSPVTVEEEVYELSDKFKKQGHTIDVKIEKLVGLFNTISKCQSQTNEIMGSSEYSKAFKNNYMARKKAFCKKKLAEANETRAEIIDLGGKAPLVPSDLSTPSDK